MRLFDEYRKYLLFFCLMYILLIQVELIEHSKIIGKRNTRISSLGEYSEYRV